MVSGKCFSDLLMLLCMLMIGGELGKQKQLELRIAADCLNGGVVRLWERVGAGEAPRLGNVGVNLWEINDECQSAEGFV